eukprot:12966-Heterococcus_DN1.PRE.1
MHYYHMKTHYYITTAGPESNKTGTCIKPPPPPVYTWLIPGTIQAGKYNKYKDVNNPYNIGE